MHQPQAGEGLIELTTAVHLTDDQGDVAQAAVKGGCIGHRALPW